MVLGKQMLELIRTETSLGFKGYCVVERSLSWIWEFCSSESSVSELGIGEAALGLTSEGVGLRVYL